MQCEYILRQLDDYLDGTLSRLDRNGIKQHLHGCADCRAEYRFAEDVFRQYQNQLAIKPRAGYEQRMLRFLDRETQKPRFSVPTWFTAGFSTAVATLLVVWLIGFNFSDPTQDNLPIITVELPAMQSRKVDLVFNSPRNIQNAAMTIELPADTEIVGYPGQRKLEWQMALKQGSNRLSLPIIIRGKQGGTLLAKISHEGQTRTFKLNLIPIPSSSQQLPILSS